MADLATLKSRIARELHRTDLTAEIADAIGDTVAEYQAMRFAFNQARSTFVTADGTEFYTTATIPSDIGQIDSLRLTVNGRLVPLEPWAYEKIEHYASTTSARAHPHAWAWYAGQIRLYPVPDGVYTLTISYLQQLDVPATDDASNAWTNEAEALTRQGAKRRLCADVLMDPQGAQTAGNLEMEALARLRKESRQLDTGTLRGSM